MSLETAGPGTTAPKLLNDFVAFDPLNANPNVLIEHPPVQGEGPPLAPGPGACRHEYTTNAYQSVPPPLDLRSDGSTRYKLALVCKRCRIHADIKINYSRSQSACPSSTGPLHHFQQAREHPAPTQKRITYDWQCSVPECQARLVITYRLPRLSKEQLSLLTTTEDLKRRYEELLELDPNREGVRQATAMESLSRMRRYVTDSLDPSHNKRQFPANNKRFQEAFGLEGQDCREIFEQLGFTYGVSVGSSAQNAMGKLTCMYHRIARGVFPIQNQSRTASSPTVTASVNILRTPS